MYSDSKRKKYLLPIFENSVLPSSSSLSKEVILHNIITIVDSYEEYKGTPMIIDALLKRADFFLEKIIADFINNDVFTLCDFLNFDTYYAVFTINQTKVLDYINNVKDLFQIFIVTHNRPCCNEIASKIYIPINLLLRKIDYLKLDSNVLLTQHIPFNRLVEHIEKVSISNTTTLKELYTEQELSTLALLLKL